MSARRSLFNTIVAPLAAGPMRPADAKGMLDDYRDESRTEALREAADLVDAMLTAEPDTMRASALYEALLGLRGLLPCTCARSQGLHAQKCHRYVAGHELISPVSALAKYRAAQTEGTGQAGKDTCEGESTQPADLTVYRASHDAIVMGLYTTREAAQHHCEASASSGFDAPYRSAVFAWHEAEENGVVELYAAFAPSSMPGTPTGYVVTPLLVASEYDEEDDEISIEPTDFFQPDHTYTHRYYGSDFLCVAVGPHPVTREHLAIGWHSEHGAWHRPAAVGINQWNHEYDARTEVLDAERGDA
jgi:hypothetical protein